MPTFTLTDVSHEVWVESLTVDAGELGLGNGASWSVNKRRLRGGRRDGVDLIIVDILMPGLAGHELIKRLRQTPQWAKVPILVLSGYADLTRYRDLPVDGVQLKPFRVADFLTKVGQLIGPASG